jgi:2-dehydro-3-deoxyglucarate aldolase/4-hydroxy-2-oxoheptanedioate aldolase
MISHIQKFRSKLDAGRFCLGPGISFSDPAVVEALCPSVDFLWIDLEHSPISLESLSGHLIAARAGGAPALVRVPSLEVGWIKRVLDTGAEGIIVPQIRSAAEVRTVVAACRYPPLGTRGYGPRRPSNYGRNGGAEYIAEANKELFVSVQIEAVEAVQELDAILAVPGLDCVVVGPQDLSGSMGLLGQIQHPTVMETISHIVTKARRAGRYVGMGVGHNEEFVCQAARMGVHWVQCGGDFSFLVAFADQLYGRVRKLLADER